MARPLLRGGPLQKAIIQLARQHGWLVAHFTAMQDIRGIWRTPAAADGKGFPDLILARERVLAIEVKGDGDSLKPEQARWLEAFDRAGVQSFIVSPAFWRSGQLDDILK